MPLACSLRSSPSIRSRRSSASSELSDALRFSARSSASLACSALRRAEISLPGSGVGAAGIGLGFAAVIGRP
jgi:hypothetical protein